MNNLNFENISYKNVEKDRYAKENIGFEEQFNNKKKIGSLNVVDINPKENSDKNKVVFAPGFSGAPITVKNTLREFHEKNRGVITLNYPRIFGEVGENPSKEELSKEVLRRATSLSKLILFEAKENEENDIEKKIDIVGHSSGGVDAILASIMVEEKMPGVIGNIVIVDSAGILGENSSDKLKERLKNQSAENKEILHSRTRPPSAVDTQKISSENFFKYLIKNPKRAIDEITGLTNVRLEKLIVELKNKRDIGIAIIHGVDDKTIPMKMVQDSSREIGLAGIIDGFYSVSGGHNELNLNPEKYVGIIDEVLSTLNKKKENKKTEVSRTSS